MREKKFGKRGTEIPSYAWKRFSRHHRPRLRPSRPTISSAGKLVSHRLNPVASNNTSMSVRHPSAVTMPVSSTRAIVSVSKCTWGLRNVG